MAEQRYNLKLQNPVNSAAQWRSINPVLLRGEIALESDTRRFKIGDGTTAWNDLFYANISNGLVAGEGIYFETVNTTTDKIKATLLYDNITSEVDAV